MIVTWRESNESSSQSEEENEEVANLCLMAQEDKVTSKFMDESYDELQVALADLISKFKKLSSKYRNLEVKNQSLLKENINLLNYKDNLSKENDRLVKEVEKLKPIVDKFTLSSQKLNLVLDSQKAVYDKAGLGYNPSRNQKYLRNMFSKWFIFNPKIAYYKLNKVSKKYDEYNSMDKHIS